MDTSVKNMILLTISLSCTLFQTISAAKLKSIATQASTVEEICKLAENPKLCQSSVGKSLHGTTTAEIVLKKQIEATLQEMDRAQKESEELQARDPTNDKHNGCFKECALQFKKAEDLITEALKALGKKDIPHMETCLADAVDHYDACDDVFDDAGLEPMLEETTHQLHRLTGNCQFLARAMEPNEDFAVHKILP